MVKCRMLREDFVQIGTRDQQRTDYWGRSERFGRVDDIVQSEPSHQSDACLGWGSYTCRTQTTNCDFKFVFIKDHLLFVMKRSSNEPDGRCWVCGEINTLIEGSRHHQTLGEHVGS